MPKQHYVMKDIPKDERPYEKCLQKGASALSDAELLAIIINTGTRTQRAIDIAYALLKYDERYTGLEGLLKLELADFCKIEGIGVVKGIRLLAVFELAKRLTRVKYREAAVIDSPGSAAEYYMAYMFGLTQEELHLMMLDNKNRLIREELITKGLVNMSLIDPREIFIHALHENAVRIILVHNHPSGDPSPSKEDLRATDRVRQAGELIGIELIDHIVIGANNFYSICENCYT